VRGAPVSYEGVSVVEHDGRSITRFRAYFNPEVLGWQVEKGAAGGQ